MVIGAYGLDARFVEAAGRRGDPIVSRGTFPGQIDAAVKQKARWIAGIALAGWDHLGWPGPRRGQNAGSPGHAWLTRWMLWRDRRAPLAALILLAAYLGLIATALGWIGHGVFGWGEVALGDSLRLLLALNAMLLLWRLALRSHFTARWYGWRQAALAVPRAFVANIIAMLAARRAIMLYWRMLRSGNVIWDKTDHLESDAGHDAVAALSTRR